MRIRFLLRARPRFHATSAVESYVRVIHDDRAVVDVPYIGHVDVHHRAIVKEGAASPLSTSEAYSAAIFR